MPLLKIIRQAFTASMHSQTFLTGLGNPDNEYAGTRHNVGYDAIDALAARSGCALRVQRRTRAAIGECTITDRRVVLWKPTTSMNESGDAARAILRQFASDAMPLGERYVVIHDDLDLPLGALRLTRNGSSGGHKGVQSIIDALGTPDFLRLRIGIGPNVTPEGHRIPAERFVLARFREHERRVMDAAITHAVEAIEILLRDGLAAAQRFANAPMQGL